MNTKVKRKERDKTYQSESLKSQYASHSFNNTCTTHSQKPTSKTQQN